ncbi:MAG TPA: diaminopimelate decarboxylase [Burkholderiaceae bacterium]|nr:diaminopimelate decarboxylase [Burkholderiaceae bacterium]
MHGFPTAGGRLHAERVPLDEIAERFGTPTWVYSRAAIEGAWDEFAAATAGRRALVCYAIKANSSLAVLELLARRGAGFDIVSGGELARVLAAGGDPGKVVFSGVGKTAAEMRQALAAGVRCFNVESESELSRLDAVARGLGVRAPVSLRINPDVDAGTHPYISTGLRENKFGIAHERALDAYRRAASLPNLRVEGIDCHIGSQITELAPFLAALDRLLELVDALEAEGIAIRHVDLGGGLGIAYRDETPPARGAMLAALFARIDAWARERGREAPETLFEFGRAMVGNAGVLLTRVEILKRNGDRDFAVVDAAMNDLMRPAMYEAWHEIVPVAPSDAEPATYDVVGPVCESGDWLGRGRRLAIREGDLLAILSAGAYGMAMSSNYNTRPRGAEVMVDGERAHLIRERERIADLFAGEHTLPRD